MAITVDDILLPAKFVDLITSWGWRTKNEHFEQWNGGEQVVRENQVMRFVASLANPMQGQDGADVLDFVEFYCGRGGSAYGFLLDFPFYGDLVDQLLGTGDGSATQFQLRMNIGDATRPKYHEVQRYQTGSVTVYVDGVEDTGATVSATGLITLTTAAPVGDEVTADFHPYIPVRFEQDDLVLQHQGNFIHSSNVTLLGVIE